MPGKRGETEAPLDINNKTIDTYMTNKIPPWDDRERSDTIVVERWLDCFSFTQEIKRILFLTLFCVTFLDTHLGFFCKA